MLAGELCQPVFVWRWLDVWAGWLSELRQMKVPVQGVDIRWFKNKETGTVEWKQGLDAFQCENRVDKWTEVADKYGTTLERMPVSMHHSNAATLLSNWIASNTRLCEQAPDGHGYLPVELDKPRQLLAMPDPHLCAHWLSRYFPCEQCSCKACEDANFITAFNRAYKWPQPFRGWLQWLIKKHFGKAW